MKKWISVEDKLPELTETLRVGHIDKISGEYIADHEFPRSAEVAVAEQKGEDFEEDIGYLMRAGWSTNCDNVTHWR